jgi:hypothetical protein
MLSRVAFKPRRTAPRRVDPKRCPPFLRWLRKLPCFLSVHVRGHQCVGEVRACHFDPWGDKGMSSKVSDCASLPMCDGAHIEQGDVLGWPEFQRKYAFDGRDVVTAYWTEWLATPAGRAWALKAEEV